MEITYTFCDVCNIARDPEKTMELSDVACKAFGLPEKTLAIRGVFEGTFERASYADGWKEKDFGHCCPVCAQELDLVEASGDVVVGIEELGETLVQEAEKTKAAEDASPGSVESVSS